MILSREFVYYNLFGVILFLILAAITSLFFWVFKKDKNKINDLIIIILSFAFALSFSHLMFYGKISSGYSTSIFNNVITTFLIFLSLLSVISSKDLINKNIKFGEYYFLLIMALIGSILIINTQNLLNIFIFIELISMSLYGIIAMSKENESIEASIKYFILGSFASILLIVGIIFIYINTHSLNLNDIKSLADNKHLSLATGMIFFISGFLFKLALVPLHWWVVDVYCGSNSNVTMLMIGFVKVSIIITTFRIFSSYLTETMITSFYIFTILTLILPNILALFTKNIKKIITYSSISHAGYIAVAFLGKELWQVYFYAIIYSITAIGIFSVIILLEKNYQRIEYEDIKGLYHKKPDLAISLSIFLFSLAGVPPFSGFFAKFYSFYNALNNGYKFLVLIAAITSAISLYYYIKIMIPSFFSKQDEGKVLEISSSNLIVIHLTAILTLLLGIFSNPVIELLKKLS